MVGQALKVLISSRTNESMFVWVSVHMNEYGKAIIDTSSSLEKNESRKQSSIPPSLPPSTPSPPSSPERTAQHIKRLKLGIDRPQNRDRGVGKPTLREELRPLHEQHNLVVSHHRLDLIRSRCPFRSLLAGGHGGTEGGGAGARGGGGGEEEAEGGLQGDEEDGGDDEEGTHAFAWLVERNGSCCGLCWKR